MKPETIQTALSFSERLRLCLPERQRSSRAGDLLGTRAGGSVEFSEHRDYQFGDDPRNVDWRAFARTERLMVKLFREEISPKVDVILDRSLSMASDPDKEELSLFAAALAFSCARKRRLTSRLFALSDTLLQVDDAAGLADISPLPIEDPVPALRNPALGGRGGVRILVSDFLFPMEASALFSALAGADHTVLIQVLSDFEENPPVAGDTRLREAETGEILDLVLTAKAVSGYRKKLSALQDDLALRVRTQNGAWAVLCGRDSFADATAGLLSAGILEPVE